MSSTLVEISLDPVTQAGLSIELELHLAGLPAQTVSLAEYPTSSANYFAYADFSMLAAAVYSGRFIRTDTGASVGTAPLEWNGTVEVTDLVLAADIAAVTTGSGSESMTVQTGVAGAVLSFPNVINLPIIANGSGTAAGILLNPGTYTFSVSANLYYLASVTGTVLSNGNWSNVSSSTGNTVSASGSTLSVTMVAVNIPTTATPNKTVLSGNIGQSFAGMKITAWQTSPAANVSAGQDYLFGPYTGTTQSNGNWQIPDGTTAAQFAAGLDQQAEFTIQAGAGPTIKSTTNPSGSTQVWKLQGK